MQPKLLYFLFMLKDQKEELLKQILIFKEVLRYFNSPRIMVTIYILMEKRNYQHNQEVVLCIFSLFQTA